MPNTTQNIAQMNRTKCDLANTIYDTKHRQNDSQETPKLHIFNRERTWKTRQNDSQETRNWWFLIVKIIHFKVQKLSSLTLRFDRTVSPSLSFKLHSQFQRFRRCHSIGWAKPSIKRSWPLVIIDNLTWGWGPHIWTCPSLSPDFPRIWHCYRY